MSNALNFANVPAGVGGVEGTIEAGADGTWSMSTHFVASGEGQGRLQSGTDVVLVVDASFSMFAGFYRSGKVLDFVDGVASFVMPYDDDGVDVYLHSLKDAPFRHLGAFRQATEVSALLGEYMETGSAMKAMGQKTLCAPVLRDVARRLKEEKGSQRVFVEVITDGAFDDKDDLEAAIVELGRKYNTEQHPFGFRIHFTGIGAGGAKAAEYLKSLDDGLADKYPGYLDCFDYDAAADVAGNIASIVKELKQAVRLDATNVLISVMGDGAAPTHACGDEQGGWQDGGEVSLESLPAHPSIHAIFPTKPSRITIDVTYMDGATGDVRELHFEAGT